MQRYSTPAGPPPAASGPRVLLFERNDAVAVPLISRLRMAGYDVRAARIPVEVFDLMGREPIDLVLIDLGNAAANRREFWVGLDSQRSKRPIHVLTFRYMQTGETGQLEEGLRVARADVEIQSANGFDPLIEAVKARLPGAKPVAAWQGGPPPNLNPQPLAPLSPSPGGAMDGNGWAPPNGHMSPSGAPPFETDDSPFAQPYASNPFKRRLVRQQPPPATGQPAAPPQPGQRPSPEVFSAFGASLPHADPSGPVAPVGQPSRDIPDTWAPPEPSWRKGIAYRGYDEEPLAPDDPRIDDATSPVPAVGFAPHDSRRNERALSTILAEGAVMAPQRLDALRSIQQTLVAIGMNFSLAELAMLFRFLTSDQLLAALLVSRGLVTAERIASLGRIKQELLATGKDYDLETLLIMFDVLPAEQVRALRAELG